LSVGLALGTCFVDDDGRCYNQIRFYDRDGAFLGFHSKILRCASWSQSGEGELYHYAASPLRSFDFHGTPVGGLICNDMWANPGCTTLPDEHLSQQLAGMGAKIIFHAVNGGRDASEFSTRVVRNYHESNLLMRARSAGVFVATVDNCAPEDRPCSSPGGIVSPEGEWMHTLPVSGTAIEAFEVTVY
jgi:predicted amidohydrolase